MYVLQMPRLVTNPISRGVYKRGLCPPTGAMYSGGLVLLFRRKVARCLYA